MHFPLTISPQQRRVSNPFKLAEYLSEPETGQFTMWGSTSLCHKPQGQIKMSFKLSTCGSLQFGGHTVKEAKQ